MGHSYTSSLFHCVFSTKDRQRLITPTVRDRLCPYIGGIGRKNKFKLISSNEVPDHIHLLISIPATMAVAKAVQLVKGGSSKWIHDTFPDLRRFAWQEGYGAFSISISGTASTITYIQDQEELHRKKTFEEEFVDFLKKHGIDYDERYVFG